MRPLLLGVTLHYTLTGANAALPEARRHLEEARAAVQALRNLETVEPPRADHAVNRPQFHAVLHFSRAWRALGRMGVQVKDLEAGLLDFPARHGGRTVLLCVRDGEDHIGFWHDLETGFGGRRPVTELDAAARGEEE